MGAQAAALGSAKGNAALRAADVGVRRDGTMVLETMGIAADGMLLFWVALSTVRIYFPRRQAKAELIGA